jgi:hypothetical protein
MSCTLQSDTITATKAPGVARLVTDERSITTPIVKRMGTFEAATGKSARAHPIASARRSLLIKYPSDDRQSPRLGYYQ